MFLIIDFVSEFLIPLFNITKSSSKLKTENLKINKTIIDKKQQLIFRMKTFGKLMMTELAFKPCDIIYTTVLIITFNIYSK